jgi:hypothetical protein
LGAGITTGPISWPAKAALELTKPNKAAAIAEQTNGEQLAAVTTVWKFAMLCFAKVDKPYSRRPIAQGPRKHQHKDDFLYHWADKQQFVGCRRFLNQFRLTQLM